MAFLNTPRFFEWVLVSTFRIQQYYYFITLGGQPVGFRRPVCIFCLLNLPIMGGAFCCAEIHVPPPGNPCLP